MLKKVTLLLFALSFTFLTGCASVDDKDERDPIESLNRGVYKFNDGIDRALIKPIAKGYDKIMPAPIDKGVTNFFDNLEDVITVANDLLQFKFQRGGSDALRVVINSTVGLLGLLDPATGMGFERHDEDFGQTLGYWGVGAGPYIVLPILGPSSLRDVTGDLVDSSLFNPIYYVDHIPTRNTLIGLKGLDTRASLLGASNILEQAALDPYSFIRESYFQQREDLINDGELTFPE